MTSGPSGFELTDTTTSIRDATADIVGFDLGEPDVAGLLRARRPRNVSDRDYTLTYTAYDAAEDSTQCLATVVVPQHKGRDQN